MAGEANKGAAAQVALDEQKLQEAVAQAYETWRQEQVNNAYKKMLGAQFAKEIEPVKGKDGFYHNMDVVNQLRQFTGAFGDPYKYMRESKDLNEWVKDGFTEVFEPELGDIMVQYENASNGLWGYPKITATGMYNGKSTGSSPTRKYHPWITAGTSENPNKYIQEEDLGRNKGPKRYYRFTGTDADKARIQKETDDRLRNQVAEVQARKADWEANAPMEAPGVANVPVNDLTPEPVMTTEQWLAKMPKRR